jgi:hypothetical protein
MAKGSKSKTFYRSAKTGKIVSKDFAKGHPATTVKEKRQVKGKETGGTGPRRK